MIAYFVGMLLGSLLFPAVLLLILKAIPATRHANKAIYGVCGVLAALVPWVSAREDFFMSLSASLLLAVFFYWGYRRSSSRAQAVKA